MRNLLKMKGFIQQLYSQRGAWVDAGVKLVFALIALLMLNANIGTMALFKNPVIVLGISVMCAVIPKSLMIMLLSLVMVAHCYGIAMEVAALMLIVLLVMYLFYFRLAAGDSFVLILLPILMVMNIPFVMPLVLGLISGPFSIVSVGCGVVVYFVLDYLHVNMEQLQASDGMAAMSQVAKEVFANQSMYMMIIAFSMVLVAVFVIRKLSIEFSWMIAVAAGTVIELVMMLVGYNSFGIKEVFSILMIILGNIVSLLLALFVCFMLHHVDYRKKERVQFEDEDYYYYVTAIPKVETGYKGGKKTHHHKEQKKSQKRGQVEEI